MRSLKKLRKNENGSATIEFVLWVPWFALLLMLTVDTSFMYLSMTRMENAARDAARRVSTGQYTPDTIVDFTLSGLPDSGYTVSSACTTADYACVQIFQPVNSMTPFGVFESLVGETFNAEVKMRLEPGVSFALNSHGGLIENV